MRSKPVGWVCAAAVSALACVSSSRAQSDLLPDIIIDVNQLYDHVLTQQGTRTLLKLSNGTANIGAGKLYLYGSTNHGDGTQDVVQRIYRTDGTSWERVAGIFLYHPAHNHIHFENWCQYRLRERIGEDGLGPVVATGEKTSFCILDLAVYDSSLPGFPPGGQFRTCDSTTQGLSVGWMDIYSKNLVGQEIDVTGVPDGNYWLESEVDPANHVLESNEDNNVTRIKIVINSSPDRYEPNDTIPQVKARTVGAVNSPNLGPTGPTTRIDNLSVHLAGNTDVFRFYSAGLGGANDKVRIDFTNSLGNLNLTLYTDAGQFLASSASSTNNFEQISLTNRPRGWYNLIVTNVGGATNPNYSLTVDPAANGVPSVEVLDPPAGNIELIHGIDAYLVRWDAADPEVDPTWVTVYVNTVPALDGNEVQIPSSYHTDGAVGLHALNSAYVEPGTYWVYCEVTDGGTVSGAWSAGTLTFVEQETCTADFNGDGFLTGDDFDAYVQAFTKGMPNADLNEDGFVTGDDFDLYVEIFLAGC